MMNNNKKTYWNNFWKNRTLTSFSEGDYALGYKGELLEYWNAIFSTLPDGAFILDAACGNGGLAVAAIRYSREHNKNFTIYACDIADINPVDVFKHDLIMSSILKDINFFPKTLLEDLPFDNDFFDIVISQFGFEYSQYCRSIKEIFRVLKNQGRFESLSHSDESFLYKDSMAGLSFYQHIFKESGFVSEAKMLFRDDHFSDAKLDLSSKNKHLFASAKKLSVQYAGKDEEVWCRDFLSQCVNIFSSISRESELKFKVLCSNLIEHRERITDQISVSFSRHDISQDIVNFDPGWLTVRVEHFFFENQVLAWKLSFDK